MKIKPICMLCVIAILIFVFTELYAIPEKKKEINVEVENPYVGDYLYTCPPYPIPSISNVNIEIYWDPRKELKTENVSVYNVSGTRIKSSRYISLSRKSNWNGTLTWNTSSVLPGVYIIIIKHGATQRFVKILAA